MQCITILGNVCRDNDVRTTFNGSNILKNTIAVKRLYRNAETGAKETDFIPYVAMGKMADILSEHTKKGSKVMLFGEMRSGSYEKNDGTKVYTLEMFVTNCESVYSYENSNYENNPSYKPNDTKSGNYGGNNNYQPKTSSTQEVEETVNHLFDDVEDLDESLLPF